MGSKTLFNMNVLLCLCLLVVLLASTAMAGPLEITGDNDLIKMDEYVKGGNFLEKAWKYIVDFFRNFF